MEKAGSVNLWGWRPHRSHGRIGGEEVETALSSYLFRKPRGKEREKLKIDRLGDNCWIKIPEEKGRDGIQILGGRTCLRHRKDISASETKTKEIRVCIGSSVDCNALNKSWKQVLNPSN